MEEYLRVGVITKPHGVRGEVKVYPTTDDMRRFKKLKYVYLDTGKDLDRLDIDQVKFFKDTVILKFKGLDRVEDIEGFRQMDLLIDRSQTVPLADNENFIPDLLGLRVITDDGSELGILTDVLATGANDVYCVTDADGREILIPAIKDCILDVDPEGGTMKVHLLEGLLDL